VPDDVVVELVGAADVRPLRHEVLRPGRPLQESVFDGDDEPFATHVAVRARRPAGEATDPGAATLAVGSVVPSPPPWEPARSDGWRIRGMATRPSARGGGLGRIVLDTLLSHVARHGGGVVWCNARTGARGLYEDAGFVARGDAFDLPGIGLHLQMWRTVDPA
jgi:GNAT superfamily N-acetyltransferase